MATRPLAVSCVSSVVCMLLVSVASAQDSATAGALFERGVADMEAGRFESACPAIEESQRIDPRPGTLFTLAECHARWGKVASAAAQYQEYVDLVSRLAPDQQQRHKARADIARAQLSKLKPSVPTLTLALPPDAPPGTFVTRNGEVLKGAALGLPLPVDPGEYLIVTHVPGGAEHQTKVTLQLAETKRVLLDTSTPTSAPDAALAPALTPKAPASNSELEPAKAPGSGRRTVAYIVGGVGVAGIAVGTVTGIVVLGKKQTVNDNCSGSSCNDVGLSAANSAQSLATVSNIGFGLGIAGLAASAVLLLTGGSSATAGAPAAATRFRPIFSSENGGMSAGLFRRW